MVLVWAAVSARAATPALTFQDPVPLTAGGAPINIGNHAAPRLVDWNNDGALDLLVAGGDGYVWLFRQTGAANGTDFAAPVKVTAAGAPVRAGAGYTGACFADMDGDGKPDLVAAGNDNIVRYFRNTGTLSAPAFAGSTIIAAASGSFRLPGNVGGRVDIADWDRDGLPDLLAGDFDGGLTLYRNVGTKNVPKFAFPGARIHRGTSTLQEPYNLHPRVIDLNQDGRPDIVYGVNWGYFKLLLNDTVAGTTNFTGDRTLRNTAGQTLDIRPLNGDDGIPDFADLNGDGVLDLISGGLNGQLFFMAGVSYTREISEIEAIMAAHTASLGPDLAADGALRDKLFGLHRALRGEAGSLLPLADRTSIRDWYKGHIAQYPQYLKKRQLSQTAQPYVPYLAGQVWVNLYESMPDTPEHRRFAAEASGFAGVYSNLLVDLGIVYIDNSRSTLASQTALYNIAKAVPPELQIVERITLNDFLKTPSGAGMDIEARTGVNLFAQVGDYSEGFPAGVPQTLIDGFCVVVSHELNHNAEHAAGRIYPWFWDRKYDLLQQASPPDIVFLNRAVSGFGIDVTATQARFKTKGYWDGNAASWAAAYDAYWATGAGKGYDRHWLRDNLRFCLDAPQEAFATLSNQYFTSSEVMFQLALKRWGEGITNCLNQFLFFADVYSLGKDRTYFYRIDTKGAVKRTEIPLQRDGNGHVNGITTGGLHYEFKLDAAGNVLEIRSGQASQSPPSLILRRTANNAVEITPASALDYSAVLESTEDFGAWIPRYTNDPYAGPFLFTASLSPGAGQFFRARRGW